MLKMDLLHTFSSIRYLEIIVSKYFAPISYADIHETGLFHSEIILYFLN